MSYPTAKERESVKLLPKYQCRVCDKWLEAANYSKRELNSYADKALRGIVMNGRTAKLRCRPCSGGPLQEKQCEGPCGMWKQLQQFSKASRSAGGNHWCQECTLWKLSNEHGVTSQAAPTGDLAPDEDDSYVAPDANGDYNADPEAGYGSSDDDDYYEFSQDRTYKPAASTAPPGPTPGTTQWRAAATGTRSQASTLLSTPVPRSIISTPYDAHGNGLGNALRTLSLNTSSQVPSLSDMPSGRRWIDGNTTGSRVVPNNKPWSIVESAGSRITSRAPIVPKIPGNQHGLPRDNIESKSTSSVSNPYEDAQTNSSVSGVWGPVDARLRQQVEQAKAPIRHTGYDNRGVPHSQLRYPSSSEQTRSANSPLWSTARPDSSQAHPLGPSAHRPSGHSPTAPKKSASSAAWGNATPPINVARSGWAKPVGARTQQTYDAAALRAEAVKKQPSARRLNDDDEDEEDFDW
ncbi:hypothetical protein BUE80_DR007249 [Diplocarpon rosae]|nr:hypothetical protein BUE80_DR007249 [Diplocarpon rosae]